MNLYDFEEVPPPEVTTLRAMKHPMDPTKTAGLLGDDPDRGRVYVSPRKREEHFFRKHAGYAVSKSILMYLHGQKTWTILILEDGERCLEFDHRQFVRGITLDHPDYDEQLLVPEEKAKHVWTSDEAYIQ